MAVENNLFNVSTFSFTKKYEDKILKHAQVIGKKRFKIKVNVRSRCHNLQKAWTPQTKFTLEEIFPRS